MQTNANVSLFSLISFSLLYSKLIDKCVLPCRDLIRLLSINRVYIHIISSKFQTTYRSLSSYQQLIGSSKMKLFLITSYNNICAYEWKYFCFMSLVKLILVGKKRKVFYLFPGSTFNQQL